MLLARLWRGICPERFVIPAQLMELGWLLRRGCAHRQPHHCGPWDVPASLRCCVVEGTLPRASPRLQCHRDTRRLLSHPGGKRQGWEGETKTGIDPPWLMAPSPSAG